MTAAARPEFHRTLGRLARTNAPPSAQDAAFIRETVDDIEKQAAEVRDQMQVLEQTLQDLENERQFFKPILSPMRRMPLEVLGEIFICTIDDYRRQSTLCQICRVCKTWREAAYLVPSLWTNTTVDPSRPAFNFDGVNSWISRARGLPRTLTITSPTCGERDLEDAFLRDHCRGTGKCHFSKADLLKLLKKTHSLERVNIACPTPECFMNLSNSLNGSCSASWNSITSFGLKWDRWFNEWENIPSYTIYRFLPDSTRSLQLDLPCHDDTPLPVQQLQVNVPPKVCKRLTALKLTCDWSAKHIFQILQYCTNLEMLQLLLGEADLEFGTQDDFIRNITQNGLSLPRLKTIQLDNVRDCSMKRLQFLKMPDLLDMTITLGYDDWSPEECDYGDNEMSAECGPAFATFVRGFSGKSSALRSLHVTGGVFRADTLLNAVQDLSNLERLVVDNAIFSEDLFTRLSAKAALPKLQSLQLLRLHINPAKLSGLQSFVDKVGVKLETSRCHSVDCEGAD